MKDVNKSIEQSVIELEQLRKVNKKLEVELGKLFTIVEQSPSVIAITNIEGNLEYVNPKFIELTGYSSTEVQGRNPRILKSNEHTDGIYKELWNTISTGKDWRGEFRNRKKNGEYYWEAASISPIFDKQGKITNYIKVAEDITERKRSEQVQKILYNISNAVNKSDNLEKLIILIKEELGTIIDATNFYVALYDKKTDTLSLPFHKDQKDTFTSFPAGKSLTAYVIKTKRPLLATKKVKDKLEKSGEIELLGADSKVWLGLPLIIQGQVTGAFAVQSYDDENAYNHSDIEVLEIISHQISISLERKKNELEIKSALEKAKESDRLKTSFINTMSHELRTPLNAVIGFSEIISGNEPIEEILDYMKIINESGIHLLNIVEEIFDMTLIESGQIKIKNEKLLLKSILQNVLNILKAEQINLQKQEIVIQCNLTDNDEGLNIITDESKLTQILINLLKNALKFTEKGRIEYGFAKEIIDKKAFLKFYVKDTGIGIPKEKHKIIFDIFRQVDESRTRKYGGAGIGLSVTKKLTELLGGTIWVESETGKGATFYFTLPFLETEEGAIEDETQLPVLDEVVFSGHTILVVEDDDTNYSLLEVILKKQNFNVIRAKNGGDAIEHCTSNQDTHLVLMDIKLPGINGYETTKQIKKIRPNLPIIAQTAHALYRSKEQSLEAGCDDYISKPIKKDDLFVLLKKHLS